MKTLKIREWYLKKYPKDELGKELKPDINFENLFETLENKKDVYEFFGVGDSLIRERCFAKLAELKNENYEFIYLKWLNL